MAISAKDVSKLRQMTGAGMMDCKKALQEANGNFEEAVVILRKKGQKVSAKRADKEASEGKVFVHESEDGTKATLIALNCETDFVAKNEEFVQLGETILKTAIDNTPATVEELQQLTAGEQTIEAQITELVGKIGEKIEVSAYETLEADKVVSYIHGGSKLGVLLALNGTNVTDASALGKDIAMQIAAMKPVAVSGDDVPEEIRTREFEIGREQAIAEGKPEKIVDKIAQGKLQKFFKENTLLSQPFVKDNSKTVQQLLKDFDANLTVKAFRRVAIGG